MAVVRRKPYTFKASEGPDKKHFISTNGMQFVRRIRRRNGTCKNNKQIIIIKRMLNNFKEDLEPGQSLSLSS